MTMMNWSKISNLENSLQEFLSSKVTSTSLSTADELGNTVTPQVRVAKKVDADWSLPVIQLSCSKRMADRSAIGSNQRKETFLVIIDIRACYEGQQKDLAVWVADQINDGFVYIQYTKNGNSYSKVTKGYVDVDFVSDQEVVADEDADKFDQYRWRLSINCNIDLTS